jgi:acyl carrier protein
MNGRGDVEAAVIDCVLKVRPSLDRGDIGPHTPLRDLGLTSLEVIAVVFEIEERFGVELVEAGLDRFRTVEEAVVVLAGITGASS